MYVFYVCMLTCVKFSDLNISMEAMLSSCILARNLRAARQCHPYAIISLIVCIHMCVCVFLCMNVCVCIVCLCMYVAVQYLGGKFACSETVPPVCHHKPECMHTYVCVCVCLFVHECMCMYCVFMYVRCGAVSWRKICVQRDSAIRMPS